MKIGNYYIWACIDTQIERENPETHKIEKCTGYFCQLYSDKNYKNKVSECHLAFGYEMDDNTFRSLKHAVNAYIDKIERK